MKAADKLRIQIAEAQHVLDRVQEKIAPVRDSLFWALWKKLPQPETERHQKEDQP